MGFGLLLPVIASLHIRHEPLRRSGAVLGTIAGTCVVIVGLTSAPETSPATMIARTVWWWTIGKMWAETGVFPRAFGWITMLLAIIELVAGLSAIVAPSATPVDLTLRLVLSAWLLVLALLIWRSAR